MKTIKHFARFVGLIFGIIGGAVLVYLAPIAVVGSFTDSPDAVSIAMLWPLVVFIIVGFIWQMWKFTE